MSEKKIVVPAFMLKAGWIGALATVGLTEHDLRSDRVRADREVVAEMLRAGLEAALRALSETPIVPTPMEIAQTTAQSMTGLPWTAIDWIEWWQRRCFLAP